MILLQNSRTDFVLFIFSLQVDIKQEYFKRRED